MATDGTRLDISLKDIRKASPSVKQQFISTKIKISEKFDGVKITILRLDTPYDKANPSKNWVVAYKNNIITADEVQEIDDETVVSSTGFAQYKFVWKMLQAAHPSLSKVKRKTEFFFEFIMKKSTLTRQYDKFKHALYLIGYSPVSSIKISGLKVNTTDSTLLTQQNEYFAKIFKANLPPVLFYGTMDSYTNIIEGCTSHIVAAKFANIQKELTYTNVDDTVNTLAKAVLDIESELGGTTEGVVIDIGGDLYKITQADQYDKEKRLEIKKSYGALDKDKENIYWEEIKQEAYKIINTIKTESVILQVKELSKIVYSLKEINAKNDKKTITQKQDDLFTTAKILLTSMTSDMKNAIFIGKMRVITTAHYSIISEMLRTSDNVAVCLVTGKTQQIPQMIRFKMLMDCFPNIKILEIPSGNIQNIAKLLPWQITELHCGTDRFNDYKDIASKLHIKLVEIKRHDSDVSATKVIDAIKNNEEDIFKALTPKEVWKYFEQLKLLVQ